MAQISALKTEAALGITGIVSPYITDGKRAVFTEGDVVYRLADLPTTGSNAAIPAKATIAYTVVVGPKLKQSDDATPGTFEYVDQLRISTSPATNDGATTRAYLGWNHTTGSPAATTSATTLSTPYFYNIVNSVGVILEVHQADITNQAGVETYVAANFATMWS